jgi:transcriptional regulator with XRE-family HTH domain
MDLFEIGALIRERREAVGMTQGELSLRSGVSRVRISHLESGRAYDMSFGKVSALLDACGMSLRVADTREARPVFEEIRRENEDDVPGLG